MYVLPSVGIRAAARATSWLPPLACILVRTKRRDSMSTTVFCSVDVRTCANDARAALDPISVTVRDSASSVAVTGSLPARPVFS